MLARGCGARASVLAWAAMTDIPDVLSLAGRVAVVTGAGRGIGARDRARAGPRRRVRGAPRPRRGRRHADRRADRALGRRGVALHDRHHGRVRRRAHLRPRRRGVGPARHPRQQRRRTARGVARGALRGGPAGDARREPARRDGLRAQRRAAHGAQPPRADPLRVVGVDAARRGGLHGLLGGEGRHRRHDANLGARARAARHHRERGRPGPDRLRDGAQRAPRPSSRRRSPASRPAGSGRRRRSQPSTCSSPPTSRRSSTARSSASTAGCCCTEPREPGAGCFAAARAAPAGVSRSSSFLRIASRLSCACLPRARPISIFTRPFFR